MGWVYRESNNTIDTFISRYEDAGQDQFFWVRGKENLNWTFTITNNGGGTADVITAIFFYDTEAA